MLLSGFPVVVFHSSLAYLGGMERRAMSQATICAQCKDSEKPVSQMNGFAILVPARDGSNAIAVVHAACLEKLAEANHGTTFRRAPWPLGFSRS